MGLWSEYLSEFLKYHGAFASAWPCQPGPAGPASPAGLVPDSLKMIPPNRPGTYLIRRALKNDSDPCNECSKRSHERQVMKVFVQRVIRSCLANNLRLLRKCSMVPWDHGNTVPNQSLNKNLHNLTLMAPF